jgi:hypothetical protein
VKIGELERAVELAHRKLDGENGTVVVLIDADDDCPATLAPVLLARASGVRPGARVCVILAKHEYEAWLIAAAGSLSGRRGLPDPLQSPANPEAIGGAKGWLNERMARGYSEVLDQPALTAVMDLTAARNADSFDKFCRDVVRLAGS